MSKRPASSAPGSYLSREWYQEEKVAKSYDAQRFRGPVGTFVDAREKLALSRALDALPSTASVCELACGTGRMTKLLLGRGLTTLATDVSMEMMGEARAVLAGAAGIRGFVRCDAAALPFKDRAFDAVVAFRFLAHLPAGVRRKVLEEAARVSRESAIFSAQSPWSLKYVYRRIVKAGRPINPPCAFSARRFAREASEFGLVRQSTHRVLPLVAETYVARLAQRRDAFPSGKVGERKT